MEIAKISDVSPVAHVLETSLLPMPRFYESGTLLSLLRFLSSSSGQMPPHLRMDQGLTLSPPFGVEVDASTVRHDKRRKWWPTSLITD